MPLPPRYGIIPTALLLTDMPMNLKLTYIILYALAWTHDYRYVTESVEELAKVFDAIESKPVSYNTMRRRMKSLETYGVIERKRVGNNYQTLLLIRHDKPAPKLPEITIENELELNLVHGRTGRVSAADRFAYSVLDDLGHEYVQQFSPEGCSFWFDIYFPEIKLLVELDNAYWHGREGAVDRDSRKDAWAEEHGFDLVRLEVDDIRDASQREQIRQALTELARDAFGSVTEQTGGNYGAPGSVPASISSNNYVVVDKDLDLSNKQQQYSITRRVEQNLELLKAMGVFEPVRGRLAREQRVTPEYLEHVMGYREQQAAKGKVLGAGWVVKCVGEGWEIPKQEQEPDRYRYIQGRYKELVRH